MPIQPQSAAIHGQVPEALPSPNIRSESARKHVVFDTPRGNFILAHRSTEWVLNEAGDLLPVIVQLSKSPGVQGVGRRGQFGEARAWYEANGLILIPHSVLPKDYVRLYRNAKGKKVHRTVFQTPVNTADKTTIWNHDSEAWGKFLQLLRIRRIVLPPMPSTIAHMLRIRQLAYDNLRVPSADDVSRRDRYERQASMLKRQIATLQDELESSYEHYGRPQAAVRSEISDLLDEALASEGIEVDGVPVKSKRASLPLVRDLESLLSSIADVATVRAMASKDSRPTAGAAYDSRISELTGEDEEDLEVEG